MTSADHDARFTVTCPGCSRTLGVPAAAVGRPARCPHCRAAFHLPANPDGSPANPILRRTIPGILLGPALGLLLIGAAGTFVGGNLAVRFATIPGADAVYATTLATQIHAIQTGGKPASGPDPDWTNLPFAAVLGAAPVAGTNDVLEGVVIARTAAAWTPSVVPINTTSLILSVLTLLGAVSMMLGRGYWLALLACAAAVLNFNHLCCVPGAVMGLWGFLTLVRDEPRHYFGRKPG